MIVDEALAKEGAQVFTKCQWCHGAGAIAGGGAPDLRVSLSPLVPASFAAVVRGGQETRGMPKFEELTDRELEALRQLHSSAGQASDAAQRSRAARARSAAAASRDSRRPKSPKEAAACAGITGTRAPAAETVALGGAVTKRY